MALFLGLLFLCGLPDDVLHPFDIGGGEDCKLSMIIVFLLNHFGNFLEFFFVPGGAVGLDAEQGFVDFCPFGDVFCFERFAFD